MNVKEMWERIDQRQRTFDGNFVGEMSNSFAIEKRNSFRWNERSNNQSIVRRQRCKGEATTSTEFRSERSMETKEPRRHRTDEFVDERGEEKNISSTETKRKEKERETEEERFVSAKEKEKVVGGRLLVDLVE